MKNLNKIDLIVTKVVSENVEELPSARIRAVTDGENLLILQRDVYIQLINPRTLSRHLKRYDNGLILSKHDCQKKYPNLVDLFESHISRLKFISIQEMIVLVAQLDDANAKFVYNTLLKLAWKHVGNPINDEHSLKSKIDSLRSKTVHQDQTISKQLRDLDSAKHEISDLGDEIAAYRIKISALKYSLNMKMHQKMSKMDHFKALLGLEVKHE